MKPSSKPFASTKKFGLVLVTLYQWVLSPIFGGRCRYIPTCSEYTKHAIEKFGLVRGTQKGLKRVCRCHPWGGHGYDPVKE